MHGSLYLIIIVFIIAGAVELYYRGSKYVLPDSIEIEPCKQCGATALLDGVGQDTFVRCSNHNCAMQGPYGSDDMAAIAAWNNLPSMSAIVAWQFQAAGLALALQRQIEMGEALRNAQWMASVDRRFIPSANEVGEEFDAALVIASKALEVRHG